MEKPQLLPSKELAQDIEPIALDRAKPEHVLPQSDPAEIIEQAYLHQQSVETQDDNPTPEQVAVAELPSSSPEPEQLTVVKGQANKAVEASPPEEVLADAPQVENIAETANYQAPAEATEDLLGEQFDIQEPAEEIIATNPKAFEELLYKEPTELYATFSHALELTIEQTHSESEDDTKRLPSIATNVVERLAELHMDKQEAVAQNIQNIVGALHGLLVLEARHAEPEAIAAVEEKLAELCVTLFEELDIEYTEKDVQDFVLLLQQPAFQAAMMTVSAPASKELGTHEAKYSSRFAWVTGDITEQVHRRLGLFTLLCSGFREDTDSTLSVKKFVTSDVLVGLQSSN